MGALPHSPWRQVSQDGVALRGSTGQHLILVAVLTGPTQVDLAAWGVRVGAWSLVLSTEEGRFGGEPGTVATLTAGRLELPRAGAVLLRLEAVR